MGRGGEESTTKVGDLTANANEVAGQTKGIRYPSLAQWDSWDMDCQKLWDPVICLPNTNQSSNPMESPIHQKILVAWG